MTENRFDYQDTGFTNPSVQAGLDRLLLAIISDLEGVASVCDLGCGNGRLALQLADQGYRVAGADASASGISHASSAVLGRNAAFIHAELDEHLAERLLVGQGALFDCVVSSDVVEHLFRPSTLLDVAWRITKPGGTLILCTPYHGYLKNLAISILGRWDEHHGVHWDGGHIKFFSVRTLRRLVADRGFDVTGFKFFGRVRWLWKNMICVARKPH